VHSVWTEVNRSPEEVSEEEVSENEKNLNNLTYERRAIATARHVTQRLKSNLAVARQGLASTWGVLPLAVRAPLQRAQGIAHSLYLTLTARAKTGLTSDDMTYLRDSLGSLRTSLESALNWAPNNLMVQVDHREEYAKKAHTPVLH